MEANSKPQEICRAHSVIQGRFTWGVSNHPPSGERVGQRIESAHFNRATICMNNPNNALEKCGLAGAIGPNETHYLARVNLERDALKHRRWPV